MKLSAFAFAVFAAGGLSACSHTPPKAPDGGGAQGDIGAPSDLGPLDWPDGDPVAPPDLSDKGPCGDNDPYCKAAHFGSSSDAKFAMPGSKDPEIIGDVVADGVGPDPDGNIVLQSVPPKVDYLWVANTNDWNRGTISRIDFRNVKEAARYLTVTCYSSFGSGGSKAPCDGTKGCCAADDYPRYQWRLNPNVQQPKRQAVDQNNTMPSRTAMDYNGDIFVANRAFNGQSSVTRIANSLADCRDYNGNKKIDTSSDVNGDGLIQTDCNNNGTPDDIDDVNRKPCFNGKKQEFYGLDDECVLWTTNTNIPKQRGRPLTLGPGDIEGGPSDAWAGTWADGKFFRLDNATGLTKASVDTPAWTNAYGAVIDQDNIIWIAASDGSTPGRLGFFDATDPQVSVGFTRAPNFQIKGYGISVDRDQNIWEGGWDTQNVYRYTPIRTSFNTLGTGYWTRILTPGVNTGGSGNTRGIAVDLRGGQRGNFYAWVAWDGDNVKDSYITRIDSSLVPLPVKADNTVDGSNFPSFKVAGLGAVGVGVDVNENIWAISQYGSAVTRAKVDVNGVVTPPVIAGVGSGCPVGDRCILKDNANSDPQPYTYSDFTGFGLRDFRKPRGVYSFFVKGCREALDLTKQTDTQWWSVTWNAEIPMGTTLSLHVRAGDTAPLPNPATYWTAWTPYVPKSPMLLFNPNPKPNGTDLVAGNVNDGVLELEFLFTTQSRDASPKLKSIDVAFKCAMEQ